MILIDPDRCDLCGSCIAVCSQDCIAMSETRLVIDNDTCIQCLNCVLICPLAALRGGEEHAR